MSAPLRGDLLAFVKAARFRKYSMPWWFKEDALRDDSFPTGEHTLWEYARYLESCRACDGALDGLKQTFRRMLRAEARDEVRCQA